MQSIHLKIASPVRKMIILIFLQKQSFKLDELKCEPKNGFRHFIFHAKTG